MSSSHAETKPVALSPSTEGVKMLPPGPFNPEAASVVSKTPGVGSKPSNEPEPKMASLPPQTPVVAVPEVKADVPPKPVQPPINFACLYYYTFSKEDWPDAVLEWGKKSVPNQYLLDSLKQTAARNESTIRMIEALQRDLKGQ